MNDSNNNKKFGFSLAEALMFLLIASLLLVAAMPVITKRHLIPGDRTPHGKWACKYIDDELKSATAAHAQAPLPPDEQWTQGCVFPELPSSVKFINVTVVGAGADGGRGEISFKTNKTTKTLFPKASRPNKDEQYEIDTTGMYKINLYADPGNDGYLVPSKITLFIQSNVIREYSFPNAKHDNSVRVFTFQYKLNRGDKLVLKSDCTSSAVENKFNDKENTFCETNDQYVDTLKIGDVEYEIKGTYKLESPVHKPGSNGCDRTLYLKKSNGEDVMLVTLKGSGGGYFTSNPGACDVQYIQNRYTAQMDRASWKNDDYLIFKNDDIVDFSLSKKTASESTIELISPSISVVGGCGGAAGDVSMSLLETTDVDFDNITIQVGNPNSDDLDRRFTQFGEKRAYGAQKTECAGGYSLSPNGADGQAANIEGVDSKGGKGAEGSYNKKLLDRIDPDTYALINNNITKDKSDLVKGCVRNTGYHTLANRFGTVPLDEYEASYTEDPNQYPASWCNGYDYELRGGDAKGIGAGGGGGGAIFALPGEKEDYIEEITDYINSGSYSEYSNLSFTADGGKGASGGIIVSW